MMILLSIVITWILIQYTPINRFFSYTAGWFDRYQDWLISHTAKWAVQERIRRAFIIGILLLLFLWLFLALHHYHHWYILSLIINVVVLLYGLSYSPKEALIFSASQNEARFVFSQALAYPFAVIFWFVVLGPWGVLLYDFMRREQFVTIQQLLEWPAARMLGLGYALAGHFPLTFSYWSLNLFRPIEYNLTFLEECGLYALNASLTEVVAEPFKLAEEAKTLVRRAELMLLVILALLAVGGVVY